MIDFWNEIKLGDFKAYYYLYLAGKENPALGEFYYFFARYGIVFFFASFIYLIAKKKIRAFLCTLLAMGVAGMIDFFVYMLWRRPRPFITYASMVNPTTSGMYADSSSFPSSHTYIVFAIATSIFLYGHRKLGTALFILAILVAVGRIGAGLHYPSDVIAGAFLGIASGIAVYLTVCKWEERRNIQPKG